MDGTPSEEIVSHKTSNIIGAGVMLGFSMMLLIDETFKIIKENQLLKAIELQKKGHDLSDLQGTPLTMTAKQRREDK